ncbi:MAG: SdiA-regulated domain-containing protein [Nevskiales bacterium]
MTWALALLGFVLGTAQAADSPLEAAEYELVQELVLEGISKDASGVTYNPDRDSLYVVANGETALYEYQRSGEFKRKIEIVGFNDTEDLAYLGRDEFALIEERTGALLKILVSDVTARVDRDSAVLLKHLGSSEHNDGVEGLAYAPDTGNLYLAHERRPRTVSVVNLAKPFARVTELWTLAWYTISPLDYSAVAYRPESGLLWLLSDASSSVTEYTVTGQQVGRIKLRDQNGDRLHDPEGMTVDRAGRMYVVAEPNRLYIFAPRKPRFVREVN